MRSGYEILWQNGRYAAGECGTLVGVEASSRGVESYE